MDGFLEFRGQGDSLNWKSEDMRDTYNWNSESMRRFRSGISTGDRQDSLRTAEVFPAVASTDKSVFLEVANFINLISLIIISQ